VQITSLAVYKWNGDVNEAFCLGSALDLTAFGYFQRGMVKEALLFASRTIIKRTQPGQRQSVEHQGAPATTSLSPSSPARQSTSATSRTAAASPPFFSRTGSTPFAQPSGCCSR